MVVFEGGYHLDVSATCAEAVLRELLVHAEEADAAADAAAAAAAAGAAAGTAPAGEASTTAAAVAAAPPPASSMARLEGLGSLGSLSEGLLRQVIDVQKPHWACLRSPEHAAAVEAYFGLGTRKRQRSI